MQGRVYRPIILILFASIAIIAMLSGCSTVGEIPVSAVTVEETQIYLSTSEVYNTYQIYPAVYPEDASNKKVVFAMADYRQGEYLSISSTGLITAKKETEKDIAVEVVVYSVENRDIKASVFVTIENVTADEVYFEPSSKTVNIKEKPFAIQPKFLPKHASVGIDITYTSTNENILQVSEEGVVTVVGVGTARITATTFSGIRGYLQVKVTYAPPQYTLKSADSDADYFSQAPGEPRTIHFTLVPYGNTVVNADTGLTYSDPSPTIVWTAGNTVLDTSDSDGLTCAYAPPTNITAGTYSVSVTIKDRDDQVLTLTSEEIKIYFGLTQEGISFSNIAAGGSYHISYGDRITQSVAIAEGQRPPDGFNWYYYAWNAAFETGYSGTGTDADIYRYLLETKTMPSDISDGDFTKFATTVSDGDEHILNTTLSASGKVFVFAVPQNNGEYLYNLFAGDRIPYTVEDTLASNIYDLRVTYDYSGGVFMPKLRWSNLAGGEGYVVEIIELDSVGNEGEITYFYSNTGAYTAYFRGSGFTVPSMLYANTQPFKARVKTQVGGYGWSNYITYDGVLSGNTVLQTYYQSLGQVNADAYIESAYELGELLNYLRVMLPGNEELNSDKIRWAESLSANFSDMYYVDIASTFTSATLATIGESGQETRKIMYVDGRTDIASYADVAVGTKEDSAQMNYLQTLTIAYKAYCESGTSQFTVSNVSFSAADGVYFVSFQFYVNADDATTYATTAENTAIVNKSAAGETNYIAIGSGATVDYFAGNTDYVQVSTSNQLYNAAIYGLNPQPVENSSAAVVYAAAKAVMDSIITADMSDFEKATAIYDWLVNNVHYDHYLASVTEPQISDASFYLEGVFGIGTYNSTKLAVCDGYAKAMTLMCWMVDIPCYKISGVVQRAGGDLGHAWCKLFIDGEWYNADPTWGSTLGVEYRGESIETSTHKYLFRSDAFIGIDHIKFGEYPPTTGTAYGEWAYYELVGAVGAAQNASDIVEYVTSVTTAEGLVSGQVLSVDVALTAAALGAGATPITDYFTQLDAGLATAGLVRDASLTQEPYTSGGTTVYILKLYIKLA